MSSVIMPSSEIEWLIYGSRHCGDSARANGLLKGKAVFVDLDWWQHRDLKSKLGKRINYDDFLPIIFHGEEYIGGVRNLEEYLKTH